MNMHIQTLVFIPCFNDLPAISQHIFTWNIRIITKNNFFTTTAFPAQWSAFIDIFTSINIESVLMTIEFHSSSHGIARYVGATPRVHVHGFWCRTAHRHTCNCCECRSCMHTWSPLHTSQHSTAVVEHSRTAVLLHTLVYACIYMCTYVLTRAFLFAW